MEQDYNIMERRKGKHLTFEERLLIQIRLKDGFKAPTIAKEIGCTPNTVRNEIKRGQTGLYHNKVFRYASSEKGSIERHNRILRRFLPKGKSMADLTTDEFIYIELWINSLPRKILGYRSPEELFEEELDKIYALAA